MKRLPPQPTNTALARLVNRLVNRLPWVRIRALQRELAAARDDRIELMNALFELRRDYRRFMANLSMPQYIPFAEVVDHDWLDQTYLTTRVEFAPMHITTVMRAIEARRRGIEPSQRAIQVLRGHAKALAAQATERMAEEIFDQTIKRLLVQIKDRKEIG